MNEQSSRSHAIFSITLVQQKFIPREGGQGNPPSPTRPGTPSGLRQPGPISGVNRAASRMSMGINKKIENGEGDWVSITSKYHFVDLAGSERVSYYVHLFINVLIYF